MFIRIRYRQGCGQPHTLHICRVTSSCGFQWAQAQSNMKIKGLIAAAIGTTWGQYLISIPHCCWARMMNDLQFGTSSTGNGGTQHTSTEIILHIEIFSWRLKLDPIKDPPNATRKATTRDVPHFNSYVLDNDVSSLRPTLTVSLNRHSHHVGYCGLFEWTSCVLSVWALHITLGVCRHLAHISTCREH